MTPEAGGQETGTERLRLGRAVAVGVLSAAVLLVVAVGGLIWWETEGTWNQTPVLVISQSGEHLEYWLSVGCDIGEARASVLESNDLVLVSVKISGEASNDSCAHLVVVTLNEPLGDRQVIDRSTGHSVQVRDWDE